MRGKAVNDMKVTDGELIVVALGGNALLRGRQKGSYGEQYGNISIAARYLASLVEKGYRLVITHGNGPQVGATLLRHEAGERLHGIPGFPLHACVAETQGFIGYIIQNSLASELARRGIDRQVVTVVTRVLVELSDRAFKNPTKPIGPLYSKEDVEKIARERPDYVFAEDVGRGGFRRVVPSPEPVRVIEDAAIKTLVEQGFIVIACGGGGIPVAYVDGELRGVDAVVDKDLASEKLANMVGADRLVILTDVDAAYLNFGRPDQVRLTQLTVEEAKRYLNEGHFAAGSMAPKILAAIRFVEAGGKEAIIAELTQVLDALAGKSGTHIRRTSS